MSRNELLFKKALKMYEYFGDPKFFHMPEHERDNFVQQFKDYVTAYDEEIQQVDHVAYREFMLFIKHYK